ncbi:hypothetical protein llap_1486 [Limosa lapponica baueri]|uniref:Uncharacterized protein n=1 Tax=Limosa lapponica baueri TaxID=1758121 RepID=A0A2I0UQ97_LIMLA|nr:hypothetical protein llap_1486 [Limosa lapponica baueri]
MPDMAGSSELQPTHPKAGLNLSAKMVVNLGECILKRVKCCMVARGEVKKSEKQPCDTKAGGEKEVLKVLGQRDSPAVAEETTVEQVSTLLPTERPQGTRYPHRSPWKTPHQRRWIFAAGLQPVEKTHTRAGKSVRGKEQQRGAVLD